MNFEIINNIIKNDKSSLIHNTFTYLELLHKKEKVQRICGAGRVISVDSDGIIYPCQGLVGKDEYVIGDIKRGFYYKEINSFGKLFAKYLERCNNCWARNLCGQPCIALSIQYNEVGDEYAPSRWCSVFKKDIESSINFYNTILEKKPEILKTL